MIGSDFKKGSNTFHSNMNYLPNVSISKKIKCMKHECVLPFDFERTFMSIIPGFRSTENVPNVTKVKIIEHYTAEDIQKIYSEKNEADKVKDFPFEQLNSEVDLYFGFPLNPRKLTNSNKCFFDKTKNSLLMISKPYLKEGMEFSKPTMMEIQMLNEKFPIIVKAYPFFDWRFLHYQKVDEKKVLFTEVSYFCLIIRFIFWTLEDG
jgi:hypothetical protein